MGSQPIVRLLSKLELKGNIANEILSQMSLEVNRQAEKKDELPRN